MKVVIVCPGWPGKVNKWHGIFVKEQALNLVDQGMDVSVVTARIFREDPVFVQEGPLKVYRFRFPTEQKILAEYEYIPVIRMCFYVASAILKVWRVARRDRVDLIHAHWAIPTGFPSVIAGMLVRRPVVLTAHDKDISTMADANRAVRMLIHYTLRRVSRIIAVTETVRQEIIKRFPDVDTDKIDVIPLGIDHDLFIPMPRREARQALDLPQDKKILLFVGGLLEIKGIMVLMEAAPHILPNHPEARLIIIGDGPLRGEIEAIIKQHKLEKQISLLGPKPHEELPQWMAAADAFVLPHLPSQGLGMVSAEALAMRLPVIVSNVAGFPEVITDGYNGLLIETGRTEAVVEAVEKILTDKKLLDDMQKNAKLDPVYDLKVTAERVKALYGKVLGSG
ncbi:MAG: glycosyltransferase [Actinomycetota bacterium]